MTNEEFTNLKNKIDEGGGYTTACCDMVLTGIKERLNYQRYQELIGYFEPNNVNDSDEVAEIGDLSFEMTINKTVAFLGVTKL